MLFIIKLNLLLIAVLISPHFVFQDRGAEKESNNVSTMMYSDKDNHSDRMDDGQLRALTRGMRNEEIQNEYAMTLRVGEPVEFEVHTCGSPETHPFLTF